MPPVDPPVEIPELSQDPYPQGVEFVPNVGGFSPYPPPDPPGQPQMGGLPSAAAMDTQERAHLQGTFIPPPGGLTMQAGIGQIGSPVNEPTLQTVLEPMLQFFDAGHLPPHLQEISAPFGMLAHRLVDILPRNPERTAMLRKLVEAKDCAVRARLYKL